MHPRHYTRLLRWSGIFLFTLALVIVGGGVYAEWRLLEKTMRAAEEDLSNLTLLFVQHGEDAVDLADGALLSARRLIEAERSRRGLERARDILLTGDGISAERDLTIVDETGTVQMQTNPTPPLPASTRGDRSYFQYHRDDPDRGLFIDDAVTSRTSGRWVLPLSRRLDASDGSFAGVVVTALDLEKHAATYRRVVAGRSLTVNLMHSDGTLLVRYPFRPNDIGQNFRTNQTTPRAAPGGSGITTMRSPIDGVERIMAWRTGMRHPLSVVTTVAVADVRQEWFVGALQTMLLRLIAAAALVLIGRRVQREIRRDQMLTAALATREAEFRLLAEGGSDLVLKLRLDGTIVYASPAAFELFGLTPDAVVGRSIQDFADAEHVPRLVDRLAQLRDGGTVDAKITFRSGGAALAGGRSARWIDLSLRLAAVRDERVLIAVARDDTEGEEAVQKLSSQALSDPLTGLANRRCFDDALATEWRRAARQASPLALLFLDLDRFKLFNDIYGHQRGDDALIAIAGVLRGSPPRKGGLVARYGGEEFVVLLPGVDRLAATRIGEALVDEVAALAIPHVGNGRFGVVTCSIGVAVAMPGRGEDQAPEYLLRAADYELYVAKDAGRNCVRGGVARNDHGPRAVTA